MKEGLGVAALISVFYVVWMIRVNEANLTSEADDTTESSTDGINTLPRISEEEEEPVAGPSGVNSRSYDIR